MDENTVMKHETNDQSSTCELTETGETAVFYLYVPTNHECSCLHVLHNSTPSVLEP